MGSRSSKQGSQTVVKNATTVPSSGSSVWRAFGFAPNSSPWAKGFFLASIPITAGLYYWKKDV
jgi:hypothetical protein